MGMLEKAGSFGKRGRIEARTPERKIEEPFERLRPMYERLNNPDMQELLERYDTITEFQKAGHGTAEDVQDKLRLEELMAERYAQLSGSE